MNTRKKRGTLRIGTSNVVVPGNKLSFPIEFQAGSRLHYYSTLFNSVELNSTFYKIPKSSTFEKWALEVPEIFRFSIKLWRGVTHVKELDFNPDHITIFLKAAEGMCYKKGCLLVQFPGKISLAYFRQVEHILQLLKNQPDQNKWQAAIEFRNPTWYIGETFELLDESNATLVMHDIPKAKNFMLNKAADCVYLRYHGPQGNYRDSYSDHFLEDQTVQIQKWLSMGKDVYAYFNNTIGNAFNNAVTLKQMNDTNPSFAVVNSLL